MLRFATQIFYQDTFTLTVCVVFAALLAYSLSSLLSSWLTGVLLFPGLAIGALAATEAAKKLGLIIGRDKELVIIGACFMGLLIASFAYYLAYNFLLWLISYNSRAYQELMQRCGDKQ